MSYSLWPHGLQHTRLPCPSPSPRACSNSCPLSQWSVILSKNLILCHLLLVFHSIFSCGMWDLVTCQFSSVAQSCPTLQPHGLQHTRLLCPSPTTGACSNSCPSSQWSHPTISSSLVPFSSFLQSHPASGSFPVSQFFTSSGQSIMEFQPQYQSFQRMFRTDFL